MQGPALLRLCQQECTFASIDQRALSEMPTRVAEWFEFITTPGGPGLHQSIMTDVLLYQLARKKQWPATL
jgi:hypothetical protein